MLNDKYKARFVTKLVLNCKYLNARFWSACDNEKTVYGDKQTRDAARFFSLDSMTTGLLGAFRQAKAHAIRDKYDELLKIIKTFPVSTTECERDAKHTSPPPH